MNRQEFLHKLSENLSSLSEREREDITAYFTEYFDESDGDESALIEKLGSPEVIAQRIFDEMNMKKSEETVEADKIYTDLSAEESGAIEEIIDISRDVSARELKIEVTADEELIITGIQEKAAEQKESGTDLFAQFKEQPKDPMYKEAAYSEPAEEKKSEDSFRENKGNHNEEHKKNSYKKSLDKKQISMGIFIVALCTFPIWLPILISIFGVMFSVIAVVFALAISFFAIFVSGIAISVAGLFLVGSGIVQLGSNLGDSLYNLAVGCLSVAVGCFIAILFFKISKILMGAVKKIFCKTTDFVSSKIHRNNRNAA